MKNKLEIRTNNSKVEYRKDSESGEVHIEGRGVVFNELSDDLGGFQERVLPEAVEGLDWKDVYSFINHDPNIVMGRTKSGTMKIDVRSDGVYYDVTPPKSAGRFVENIERGDIDGSSFAFRVAGDGDTWEERDGGLVPLRTIKRFSRIKEMGAVIEPAYPQSTAESALRSLEEWRSKDKDEEDKPDPEPEMNESTKMIGDTLKTREKDNHTTNKIEK